MDIKDYRIVENALEGFYIEYKIKYKKIVLSENEQLKGSFFGFHNRSKYETVEDEYWQRIYMHYMTDHKPFKTKQEAIEYLEKLCTPDKFYYPADFKESHE